MLRLHGDPLEDLFDAVLPDEVKVLPEDLAALDVLLADPALLATVRTHWQRLQEEGGGQDLLGRGRPTIAMDTYLRLMVVKHRGGYGYETLVAAVSDSIHLRRFCRIPLGERVPDESTVRKLTRRLGPEVADDLVRDVVKLALSNKVLRPRAIRADSTVVEADIRYPTDTGLARDAVVVLARAGRRVAAAVPVAGAAQRVRDRSRAVGLRLRALTRTLRRRSGEAKADVQRLTEETASLMAASTREAERLLAAARRSRSIGAVSRRERAKAIAALEEVIGLARRVGEQIKLRFAGKKIENRLVSLFDVDARPIRRGKLAKPNEFGYLAQYAEVTANTKPGARGLLVPPPLEAGSTPENTLLPGTAGELDALGIKVREGSFDAGFQRDETEAALPGVTAHIVGSHDNAGSRRTRRRRANFRVGAEARISHLKRSYGAGRSRLKGKTGARIWAGWSTLAYDLDTVVLLNRRAKARREAQKEAASA